MLCVCLSASPAVHLAGVRACLFVCLPSSDVPVSVRPQPLTLLWPILIYLPACLPQVSASPAVHLADVHACLLARLPALGLPSSRYQGVLGVHHAHLRVLHPQATLEGVSS